MLNLCTLQTKVKRCILDKGRDFLSTAIIHSTGELQSKNKYISCCNVKFHSMAFEGGKYFLNILLAILEQNRDRPHSKRIQIRSELKKKSHLVVVWSPRSDC